MINVKVLLAAAIALSPVGVHAAETVVNEMIYKNNGPYNAYFNVRYNLEDGTNCQVYQPGAAYTGQWSEISGSSDKLKKGHRGRVTVDLTGKFKVRSGGSKCLIEKGIPDGARVWGKVEIDGGDKESCKKSKTLIKVSTRNGNTQRYKTGGTSLKNNRCKHD